MSEAPVFCLETYSKSLLTRGTLRKLGMSMNGDCPFFLEAEENIDHIFKNCDLIVNIWYTIENNCPNPLNSSLGIVGWLEYLWLNIS